MNQLNWLFQDFINPETANFVSVSEIIFNFFVSCIEKVGNNRACSHGKTFYKTDKTICYCACRSYRAECRSPVLCKLSHYRLVCGRIKTLQKIRQHDGDEKSYYWKGLKLRVVYFPVPLHPAGRQLSCGRHHPLGGRPLPPGLHSPEYP